MIFWTVPMTFWADQSFTLTKRQLILIKVMMMQAVIKFPSLSGTTFALDSTRALPPVAKFFAHSSLLVMTSTSRPQQDTLDFLIMSPLRSMT